MLQAQLRSSESDNSMCCMPYALCLSCVLMPYAFCLMPYASYQAQLRSSESDISKLKSVIKVASDAVRKAAEEKAHFYIFC